LARPATPILAVLKRLGIYLFVNKTSGGGIPKIFIHTQGDQIGNFSPIGLFLNAHGNFYKGFSSPKNGDFLGNFHTFPKNCTLKLNRFKRKFILLIILILDLVNQSGFDFPS
jgi:hypothetical protein